MSRKRGYRFSDKGMRKWYAEKTKARAKRGP
jgi:hypothetical protein